MKCKNCDTEMRYFQKESSCGYECPNCGWGLATTYIDPINEDEVLYELSIDANKKPSINTIKVLSHTMGIGFVAAKEKLTNGGAIKTDKAPYIISLAKEFQKSDIVYHIVPHFPYDI